MSYSAAIDYIATSIDIVGVGVIVFGALFSSIAFVLSLKHHRFTQEVYVSFRHNLERVILLGLEFLVAGDIIRSIAVPPTFTSIGILGLVIIIRTVLSIELQMEIDGRWPWEREKHHA